MKRKKQQKIVGYGVTSWLLHGLMKLEEDNKLWNGNGGTVFKYRKDAVNALRRTRAYAKRTPGIQWEMERCSIQKLYEASIWRR